MAQMIRKQIYIAKHQQTFLKRLAKARGLSEAELIRQAIEQTVSGSMAQSFVHDPQAMEDILEFALQHRQSNVNDGPYKWNREELYEERFKRYPANACSAT